MKYWDIFPKEHLKRRQLSDSLTAIYDGTCFNAEPNTPHGYMHSFILEQEYEGDYKTEVSRIYLHDVKTAKEIVKNLSKFIDNAYKDCR